MTDGFTLTVPLDERFRALASEVSGRYLELAGGSADEGRALAAEVAAAVDGLGGDDAASVDVVVQMRAGDLAITVEVRESGRAATVTHPVPAKKP